MRELPSNPNSPGVKEAPRTMSAMQRSQHSGPRDDHELTTSPHRRRAASPVLRRWLVASTLVPLALCVTSCGKLRARNAIRQANDFFKSQQYDRALALYLEAEQLDPNEIRIQKFIAYADMALYNPSSHDPRDLAYATEAIARFERYLAVRPDDTKAAQLLVTLFMDTGRVDQAIAYFKQYLGDHPEDDRAVQSIAMLYAKQGDYERTVAWQKRRIAMLEHQVAQDGPELEAAKKHLAEADYTLGVTCWQKSYDSPGAALAPARRAEILTLGMDSLNTALRVRPEYADAMAYVNLIYRQMAQYEPDPARKKTLTDQADEWLRRAIAARKAEQEKQRLEEAKKNPLGVM